MTNTYTLEQIANRLNLEFVGDGKIPLSGVGNLNGATEDEVSFLSNERYTSFLKTTKAGAIIVKKDFDCEEGKNYILSDDPSRDFSLICELICEDHSPSGFTKIHPTAVIHQTAKIGKDVEIGPYVVIDKEAEIGDGTVLYSHVSIGPKTIVGNDCVFYQSAVVRENCTIGNNVILQPHAIIGSCGYGYDSCKKTGTHRKIKHFGKVVIEDDVEIGAGSTIDRGRFDKTIIRQGTKIDNQCMIAHNCDIGPNNLIVSMSGIAGSTKTGRNVTIAAQCGLVGHIEIADNVTLAARSAPIKSIKKPGVYIGVPAQEYKKEIAEVLCRRKLPSMMKKFKEAEKLLDSFQESNSF